MGDRLWKREKLVELNDCDHDCDKPCCDAKVCVANHGYHEDNEKSLFTETEQKMLKKLWNNTLGFWSETGCVLARKLRAYKCLSYDCKYIPPNTAH